MIFIYILLINSFHIKDKSENINSNLELKFNNENELKSWLIINSGISEHFINNLISKSKYSVINKKIFYNFGIHHPNPEKLTQVSANPNDCIRTAILQSFLVNIINNGNGIYSLKYGKIVSTLNFYSGVAARLPHLPFPIFYWKELIGSELDTIYDDCKQRYNQLIPKLSYIFN